MKILSVNKALAWSPDSKRIAFNGNDDTGIPYNILWNLLKNKSILI
ncbi:DPP IV N-terminal domain-containing protein [bacterium]|nr:DPP IV N-terminal domain-containing protein [bacterium]